MNKILIVGANFKNKGAQSMLFNTVDALFKLDHNCEIYYATDEVYDEAVYTFKRVYYSKDSRKIALGLHEYSTIIKRNVKDFAKMVLGRRNNLWKSMELRNIISQVNLIIDISGFGLGDKWPAWSQEQYLDVIRLAKKYNIPLIMMPQSFGPFNYDDEKQYLLKEEADLLEYPDIIFVREKEGYDLLKKDFGLDNVQLSTDLVLQKDQLDNALIYKTPVKIRTPKVKNYAVGIVPNKQCFTHENKNLILRYYKIIIDELLANNREVYIFRHSGEDIEPCQWIYDQFSDYEHVHLLKNDFSCLEYDDFVKKFQFVICSRYHGIVHAYKNAVPCIILGWAVKYKELAEQVSQGQYIFNITDKSIDEAELNKAVNNMLKNYQKEAYTIKERVQEIQKDNCFSCLEKYLR